MEITVTFSSTYVIPVDTFSISYNHTIHTRVCSIFQYVAKVTSFLPFCTIGISLYQKGILPDTLFPTYLPQADSLLVGAALENLETKIFH
jgi:hypothetical protein